MLLLLPLKVIRFRFDLVRPLLCLLRYLFVVSSRGLIYIFMQNITTTKYKFAQPKKTKKAQRDSDGNRMR